MKKQDQKDLKEKTSAELTKMLREFRERLRTLKLDLVAGKVKNVSELHVVRKDIARLLTNLNQKRHEK